MALVVCGCGKRDVYQCTASSQCVGDGVPGVCEPTGYCSFTDPSCPDGRKYEEHAGAGLAGTCVGSIDGGIEACGTTGAACCATGDACGPAAYCATGTCTTCIADVAFGWHFSCVARHDGTVWCVGENTRGQLGFGATSQLELAWHQVRDGANAVLTGVTAISAGVQHACALRDDGTVWCWGFNNFGQLGDATTTQATRAVQVQKVAGTPLTDVVKLASGDEHNCVIDSATNVSCWGRNLEGQLGTGTPTQAAQAVAVLVAPGGAAFTGVLAIAPGVDHTCAIKAGDEVWCWGNNDAGQLGDGLAVNRTSPFLMIGAGTQVDTGSSGNTCRRNPDGTASCAGSAWRSRLGNGTGNTSGDARTAVPVLSAVGGPPLTGVAQIVVGGTPCVRLDDGTVRCWGDNVHGQTGAGRGADVPTPVLRSDGTPLTGVTSIYAGFPHLCARLTGGDVVCWGRGRDGELGDGEQRDRFYPELLTPPCP